MTPLAHLLKRHRDNHPDMQVQDAVKFLHQHFCGPGHLITHHQDILARVEQELTCTSPKTDSQPFEVLGNGLCRLDLGVCKANGLSAQTIARLLVLTANTFSADTQGLAASLELVYDLGFDRSEADVFLNQYCAQGCPMVSHSQAYRDAYHPAYRVVYEYYARLLPVLCAIDRGRKEHHAPFRVAIDGPCASGKSTLGAALAEIYQCPLIHMDDFFLRPEQRTPERLAQPGGNVDYERFAQEVIAPMIDGRTITYRPWRCGEGSYGPEISILPSPIIITEGSYSLREDLRDAYHLRVWTQADRSSRYRRLLERGGEACLKQFETQWIPLEDAYFTHQRVSQCCHIHLDLSD